MEDSAITEKPPSAWVPESDPVTIAVIGKAVEELGETISALGRALIQGIDESEPVTGKPNRQWLEDEISDATTTLALVTQRFNLDTPRMKERTLKKGKYLLSWFGMLGGWVSK